MVLFITRCFSSFSLSDKDSHRADLAESPSEDTQVVNECDSAVSIFSSGHRQIE